jgi:hypothetical protein
MEYSTLNYKGDICILHASHLKPAEWPWESGPRTHLLELPCLGCKRWCTRLRIIPALDLPIFCAPLWGSYSHGGEAERTTPSSTLEGVDHGGRARFGDEEPKLSLGYGEEDKRGEEEMWGEETGEWRGRQDIMGKIDKVGSTSANGTCYLSSIEFKCFMNPNTDPQILSQNTLWAMFTQLLKFD